MGGVRRKGGARRKGVWLGERGGVGRHGWG